MQTQGTMKKQIFLGGSCDPTTWRDDTAIPLLKKKNLQFYNPQVKGWHEGLAALEAEAKKTSEALLFVIDGQTRAIASMLEATEYIMAGRKVYLVVDDIKDGTEIAGQVITGRELKDLNRSRAYFRDIAKRNGCTIYNSIDEATEAAAQALN
jgi:hypothetical protein